MCTVAAFNPWVYSKCSMENSPVQPNTPWSNPVMFGLSCSGEANGGRDGTADWTVDGRRQQPHDTDPIGEQPPSTPANGQ